MALSAVAQGTNSRIVQKVQASHCQPFHRFCMEPPYCLQDGSQTDSGAWSRRTEGGLTLYSQRWTSHPRYQLWSHPPYPHAWRSPQCSFERSMRLKIGDAACEQLLQTTVSDYTIEPAHSIVRRAGIADWCHLCRRHLAEQSADATRTRQYERGPANRLYSKC